MQALGMALKSRHIEPGLIHHSDQEVQYANSAYLRQLSEVGASSVWQQQTIPTRMLRLRTL